MSRTKTYLSLGDIAEAEGVDTATVSKWRDRYDDFPEPDIRLGKKGQWPGWRETRLPEIAAWRRNRMTSGGRPRHVTVDEAHAVGLPLAEWVAAGDAPEERTRRLIRIHHGAENLGDQFVARLQAEAGVQVENPHVRTVLSKPQGNKAGDHARGLVLTATLEHIAQFNPRIEFAPHNFPPDLLEDPEGAIAAADTITLYAPDDSDLRMQARRIPDGWALQEYREDCPPGTTRLIRDDDLLSEVHRLLDEGWTP